MLVSFDDSRCIPLVDQEDGSGGERTQSRTATAKFEATGLVANDRVKITVAAEDGGVAGEHFLTVK